MNPLITLVLLLPIASTVMEFDSYQSMGIAGFYFSPGYDCQTQFESGQIIFTATVDENNFAIFSKAQMPLEVATSGYRVSRISKIWAAGQHLDCDTISPNGSEVEIAVFNLVFDTDPGEGPDHLSFVAASSKEGAMQIVSCEWSYGKPEILQTDQGLVARYTLENGERRDVSATRIDPQC